jgi:hypothetical protein
VSGASTLKADDISTIVAYSGKIGVMWSNQNDSTVYFAYHPDGTADYTWIVNPALQSPKYADDHLNIKSLQADSAGQLFAIVKTSLNDVNPSTSTKPVVLLLQLITTGIVVVVRSGGLWIMLRARLYCWISRTVPSTPLPL